MPSLQTQRVSQSINSYPVSKTKDLVNNFFSKPERAVSAGVAGAGLLLGLVGIFKESFFTKFIGGLLLLGGAAKASYSWVKEGNPGNGITNLQGCDSSQLDGLLRLNDTVSMLHKESATANLPLVIENPETENHDIKEGYPLESVTNLCQKGNLLTTPEFSPVTLEELIEYFSFESGIEPTPLQLYKKACELNLPQCLPEYLVDKDLDDDTRFKVLELIEKLGLVKPFATKLLTALSNGDDSSLTRSEICSVVTRAIETKDEARNLAEKLLILLVDKKQEPIMRSSFISSLFIMVSYFSGNDCSSADGLLRDKIKETLFSIMKDISEDGYFRGMMVEDLTSTGLQPAIENGRRHLGISAENIVFNLLYCLQNKDDSNNIFKIKSAKALIKYCNENPKTVNEEIIESVSKKLFNMLRDKDEKSTIRIELLKQLISQQLSATSALLINKKTLREYLFMLAQDFTERGDIRSAVLKSLVVDCQNGNKALGTTSSEVKEVLFSILLDKKHLSYIRYTALDLLVNDYLGNNVLKIDSGRFTETLYACQQEEENEMIKYRALEVLVKGCTNENSKLKVDKKQVRNEILSCVQNTDGEPLMRCKAMRLLVKDTTEEKLLGLKEKKIVNELFAIAGNVDDDPLVRCDAMDLLVENSQSKSSLLGIELSRLSTGLVNNLSNTYNNTAIRCKAIELLINIHGSDIADSLKDIVQSERDLTIRKQLQNSLERAKSFQSYHEFCTSQNMNVPGRDNFDRAGEHRVPVFPKVMDDSNYDFVVHFSDDLNGEIENAEFLDVEEVFYSERKA